MKKNDKKEQPANLVFEKRLHNVRVSIWANTNDHQFRVAGRTASSPPKAKPLGVTTRNESNTNAKSVGLEPPDRISK